MTVAHTSLAAYNCTEEKRETQMRKIVELVKVAQQPMTRRQIGEALKMELGTVGARVNKLVELNRLRIDPVTIRCPTTNHLVTQVTA
jgi:hypothetical protein